VPRRIREAVIPDSPGMAIRAIGARAVRQFGSPNADAARSRRAHHTCMRSTFSSFDPYPADACSLAGGSGYGGASASPDEPRDVL